MNIYGEKVILRALEPEDMELLRESVNDPDTEMAVGGWSFPISKNSQRKWYELIDGDERNIRFAIEYEGKFCGISTLTNIDWKNRSAFHGVKLVPSAPKGIGLAFDAVSTTMRYAFEELQLNRLYSTILTTNLPSQKLYEKCGWIIEGTLRQVVFKNNQYINEYAVAILRDEYFNWKKSMK